MSEWESVYDLTTGEKISRVETTKDIITKFDLRGNRLEYYKKASDGISEFIDNFDLFNKSKFLSYTLDNKPEHFYYCVDPKCFLGLFGIQEISQPLALIKDCGGKLTMTSEEKYLKNLYLNKSFLDISVDIFVRSDINGNINCIYYGIDMSKDYEKVFKEYFDQKRLSMCYNNMLKALDGIKAKDFIFRPDKNIIYVVENK